MTADDNHREGSSLLDALRHIVETLQDAQENDDGTGAGTGTVSGKRVRTDYGFTVRTGPDPDSLWDRLEGDDPSGPSGEGVSKPATSTDSPLVDVREDDGEIVVLADLPRATAEGVAVGIDHERNDLVIGLEGDVIERIALGDAPISVADSTFGNGVLEVRLRTEPEGGEP